MGWSALFLLGSTQLRNGNQLARVSICKCCKCCKCTRFVPGHFTLHPSHPFFFVTDGMLQLHTERSKVDAYANGLGRVKLADHPHDRRARDAGHKRHHHLVDHCFRCGLESTGQPRASSSLCSHASGWELLDAPRTHLTKSSSLLFAHDCAHCCVVVVLTLASKSHHIRHVAIFPFAIRSPHSAWRRRRMVVRFKSKTEAVLVATLVAAPACAHLDPLQDAQWNNPQ